MFHPSGIIGPSFAILLLTLTGLVREGGSATMDREQSQAVASGHVLVRFNEKARPIVAGKKTGKALEALANRLGLPPGSRLEETSLARMRRQPFDAVSLDSFFFWRLPPGWSIEQAMQKLHRHPLIDYVEPDGIGWGGEVIPNDPDFSSQWHHQNIGNPGADIKTPETWELTQGSTNVVVAVLDTGLANGLVDFAGRVVPGYDFVNDDNDPVDDHGHGTAVSGALAATGNNAALVAGVDWNCRVMPIKVLDSSNFGFYSDWAQGIDYAVMNGCKVINLSAGGFSVSTTLTTAIRNAIDQGVVFVTITHNDGNGTVRYPGNLPEPITVGASDELDHRAGFSNYGFQTDLVAPGTNVYTMSRSGTLQRWWGTSFAAPLVAGVCSLMAGLNPDITQAEADLFLKLGAEDQIGDSDDTPGFDIFYGWGRLNALNSVELALEPYTPLRVRLGMFPETHSLGCPITYDIEIINQTLATATGVVVTNHLPQGFTVVDVVNEKGAYFHLDRELIFSLGDLGLRERTSIAVTLMPNGLGTFTNRLSAFSVETPFDSSLTSASGMTAIITDETGPMLTDAEALSDGQRLRLFFSEPVQGLNDESGALVVVRDGYRQIVSITQQELAADGLSAMLTVDLSGRPGNFQVEVSGLRDCAGNVGEIVTRFPVSAVPYVLINRGANWRYLDDGSDLGLAWIESIYEDETWEEGPAPLGYGEGSEATVVSFGEDPNAKHYTTYFRHSFVLYDVHQVSNLILRLQRDDGGLVYLNGQEIFRSNMPVGGIDFLTPALTAATGGDEVHFFETNVMATLLKQGTNVLAVEIHQSNATSSDLRFDLEMIAQPVVIDDFDLDGIPGDWETTFGLDPNSADDAGSDIDLDGQTALAEFLAGTDPTLGSSRFFIDSIHHLEDQVELEFQAYSNRTYSIQFREGIAGAVGWKKLLDVYPQVTNQTLRVIDDATSSESRVYRLVAPRVR